MNHYIQIDNVYIKIDSIYSIVGYRPYDFEHYKTHGEIPRLYATLGDNICDKYFTYYKVQGGGYHYNYDADNGKEIFVYRINYNNGSIYITPEQFKNLLQIIDVSEL